MSDKTTVKDERKKLLAEAVLLTRRDWLEVMLAVHAMRMSGQDWLRSYEVGRDGQLLCRCFSNMPAKLHAEGVPPKEQYERVYKGWFELEKRRVRDLLKNDERLAELVPLADSLMMDVYEGHGEASAMLCRLSAEGVGWSQRPGG